MKDLSQIPTKINILWRNIDCQIKQSGINMSTSLYSDSSPYVEGTSYNFEGDSVKFAGKECVYLKRGIGFKPRGTDCLDPMNYYCLWTRKYRKVT